MDPSKEISLIVETSMTGRVFVLYQRNENFGMEVLIAFYFDCRAHPRFIDLDYCEAWLRQKSHLFNRFFETCDQWR